MRDREHRGTPARPGAAEGDEAAGTDGAALERMRLQRLAQRKATRERAEPARIPEGAGQPLGGDVRGRMEGQLGADLSGVRVHTGADSATAADRLGARAFTVENDVHFAAGAYAPGTKDGDQLLAHELTHVVQGQTAGVQRKAEGDDAGGAEAVSQPDEPAEKEADAVAARVGDALHGDGADGAKEAAPPARPTQAPKPVGRKIFRDVNNAGAARKDDGGGEFGKPAADPLSVLERHGGKAYSEWKTAVDVRVDCNKMAAQADRLQRKHDPQSKVVEEFRAAIETWGSILDQTFDSVPAVDEKQIDIAGSEESKRMEGVIDTLYDRFNRVVHGLIDAREKIRQQVGTWLDAEANDVEEEEGEITQYYEPLTDQKDHAGLEAAQQQKVDHAETMRGATGRGQTFTGENIEKATAPVEADRTRDANELAVARAVERVEDYTDPRSGEGTKRLQGIRDLVWDKNPEATQSGAWQGVEDQWSQKAQALEALVDKNADGNKLQAQIESNIAGIEGWFRDVERRFVDSATAMRDLDEITSRAKQGAADADKAMRAALPSMREAVVQRELKREYESRIKAAESDRKSLGGGGGPSSDDTKRRLAELEGLGDATRAKVAPEWFNYSDDIDELEKLTEKDKSFTKEQKEGAKQEQDQASAMKDYAEWNEEIAAARQSIEQNPDPKAKEESLKELDEFQKEIEERYAKQWKKILGEADGEGAMEDMNEVREEIEHVILKGSMEDVVSSSLHKAAWASIKTHLGKEILGEENVEHLENIHEGLERATQVMHVIYTADKLWHAGDQTSMEVGAGNPTLDAISEALDLAHDFDKVPMFNILCKAYSDAVKHISKQVAELQQQLMHEKLGFSLVDHTFSRK